MYLERVKNPYAMMVFCADKLDPLRGYDSSKLIEICNKDIKKGLFGGSTKP